MGIPKIESYQIQDLSLLDEINEYVDNTDWYAMTERNDAYEQALAEGILTETKHGQLKKIYSPNINKQLVIKARIDEQGLWPHHHLLPEEDNGVLVLRSIVRQAYGWDETSVKRRALPVWNLFDYMNKTFFNNELTLDGHAEEVSGARHIWYDQSEKDIPGWGEDVGPNGKFDERDPTPVFVAYANGKSSSTRRIAGANARGLSNGVHRDWDQNWSEDEIEDNGYYSLLVHINKEWAYSEAGELLFYETVSPDNALSVHERRGYGVGRPTHMFGHVPGSVILYPATALHATHGIQAKAATSKSFSKKIVYRVQRRSTLAK
jgi:hypothetical protein